MDEKVGQDVALRPVYEGPGTRENKARVCP